LLDVTLVVRILPGKDDCTFKVGIGLLKVIAGNYSSSFIKTISIDFYNLQNLW